MQRYGAYKDSGVEWIGEIPAGWEVVNLSALATQRKRKNIGSIEGNVLSLSYGRIKRRIIDNSGLLPESFETYNVIEPGDIVLRLTDLQNDQVSLRVGRSDERGIITSAYCTLNPNNVDSRYLFDILACFDYQKGFYGLAGGVRQGLTFDGIKGLKFPLPSIREQQAIADYLDEKTAEIDSIVSQTERSIELLREYRKSVISEAVTKGLDPDTPMKDSGVEWIGEIPEGWELLRMKRIGSFAKGTGIKKDEVLPEGMPCVRYGELYTTYEHRIADPASFVSDDLFSRSTRLHNGEVVFALTGENDEDIGRCAVNLSGEALAVGGDTLAFTGHRQDGRFIAYSCNSKYFNVQRTLFARGGIIVHLPAGAVINATIVLPPLPEQQAIADYLDAKTAEIDSLIADKQRQVKLLKEYRKSLISEAVTGKFKVPGLE